MSDTFTTPESKRLAEEVTAQCLGTNVNDVELILTRSRSVERRQDRIATLGAVIQLLQCNHNRLLPVDALPDEMLLITFKLVMEVFSSFDEYTNSTDFHEGLKLYYAALARLRAVCRRWCRIVVSHGPFWCIFDYRMPKERIELGLSRAGNALLTVGALKHLSKRANQLIQRMAPFSRQVSRLMLNLPILGEEAGYGSAVWTKPAPNLQQLVIRHSDVDLFPAPESCFGGAVPSLRWSHICDSNVVPSIPALYERLEELTFENPSHIRARTCPPGVIGASDSSVQERLTCHRGIRQHCSHWPNLHRFAPIPQY